MRKTLLGLMGACLLAAGCSEATVDGSSEDSFKASLNEVRASLDGGQKGRLDEALSLVAMQHLDVKAIFAGTADADSTSREVRQHLDGMNADEILAEADRIKAERKRKEREQALKEIAELREKKQQAEAAEAKLKAFEVLRSRFYKRKDSYTEKPVIELTVKNGTDAAISRAYFNGTLASPDRSVPWVKESFNYQIAGGLEPGEEATWKLAPNMFSDWGTTDVPSDAVLTVEVYKLDGPDGEELYSTEGFQERDAKRLEELEREYVEGEAS